MKDKTVTALLAILLGSSGVHKFYLGRPKTGIFYFLFCWTFIPGMIAFFEGLFLFGTTNKKFNEKYNKNLCGCCVFSSGKI